MKKWLFFLLLPILVFAVKPEKTKILMAHEFGLPGLAEITRALAEKKIDLVTSDLEGDLSARDVDYVVVWNKPHFVKHPLLDRIPKQKAVLFLWEPPTVSPKIYSPKYLRHFKRIYTWDDSLVDNKRFFKLYYPELKPMIENTPSFQEKKLCTFMFTKKTSKHPKQLYTAREDVIKFFEDKPKGEFEFYGKEWGDKGYKNYLGSPKNKIEILKNYRFTICYENMQDVKGYVTEKIFDCFAAGTVPIYWGASNIEKYVPEGCFIDRRKFKDNQELYEFMQNMNEATYSTYLENIRAFLSSDKVKLFSPEMFSTIFLEAVRFP